MASKDVPQSIAVVGEKVMEEQDSKTLADVLSNIASISNVTTTTSSTEAPGSGVKSSFAIRGFSANILSDGLKDSNASGWIGNVEQVEVLKGPSSILYGSGGPGGIINEITKKPLPEYSMTIDQSFGSWGTTDTSLDASIPLTKDKTWSSRIILDKEKQGYFQKDVVDATKYNGFVVVQGKPKKDTTYTFEAEFNDYDLPGRVGILPYKDAKGVLLSSRGITVPYDGNYFDLRYRTYSIGRSILGKVEQKVNDTWTIDSTLKYSNMAYDFTGLSLSSVSATGTTISRRYYGYKGKNDTLAWETNGKAKFKTWGLENNAVLGVDWSRTVMALSIKNGVLKSGSTIDLLNPVFTNPVIGIIYNSDSLTSEYQSGAYLSDIITVSPKLKVATGISRSRISDDVFAVGGGGYSYANQGTSHRLGLTYEARPGTTWFVGRSTSYDPTGIGYDVNGNIIPMPPTSAAQWEGGVKIDVTNRASVTLSLYNIDYTNLRDTELINGHNVTVLTGKQNNRGFDMDMNYVIKPGWNVLLSYAHLDAKVTENNAYPQYVGNRPINTPLNALRLWSSYEFQEGAKKGLGFAIGLTYAGKRAADSANSYWMDGYTTVDGAVYYKKKDYTYRLNLYNLTNKKYWQSAVSSGLSGYVFAGQPRSFTLSIEKKL